MKRIGFYRNNNYTVSLFNEGTKIRRTEDEEFKPIFPESMDVKISNQCDMGCPMCHENSTVDGKIGDIMNAKFIDTLHPYTEMALGGGNVLTHPDLVPFLRKLKLRHIFPSITVNQKHFMKDLYLIKELVDERLIYGLGISVVDLNSEFLEIVKQFPNAVLHIINGLISEKDIEKLYDKNLKVLILGYKTFRRGVECYQKNHELIDLQKQMMFNKLKEMTEHISVVSFDNLAIEQLDVKRLMSEEEWNQFYMGNDGNFTMYIDLVEKQFAASSISTTRHNLKDNIEDMFKVILEENNNK